MKATQGTATAAREKIITRRRKAHKARKAGRGKDTHTETRKPPYRAKSERQTQPTRARTNRTASHKGNGQRQTGNAPQGHGRTEKAQVIYFGKPPKNFFLDQNFTPKHFLQTFGAARSQDQNILVREILENKK